MGNCISAKAATYPGNKRVAKPAYQPADDDYQQVTSTTAIANAHFVTCPGGNALKLVGKPNRAEVPVGSEGLPTYISVTLPPGVQSGDIIHVKAPDGRMNAISVPEGMGPGSTFTVEFSGDTPPPKEEDLTPGVYVPTVVAEPEVETGMPYYGDSYAMMETAATVAKPTDEPYVPAYASK
mmetsp:Transcript_38434/g.69267  ORF Transcript_38434/g.69267 Transcript_38434/m.69267 type:complete len:180 (+) Transcript_38434:279-818(+)|eukprot:CAMPEP_0201886488 /NCGR_PEP_ID=MMETSP0902-20130614/22223_1 /ASSEMBLY_ACC=CAM_ASM_000551 /TAXON_ID=420261 /ORGANISM="Thalassiosira antarctica, Strain CCMP982" /LENGTH=179 /DNA_ID=CAMNT_0048416077 /DNA_START=175 /DNA_END=714 /DNA_ORIENTATION=+